MPARRQVARTRPQRRQAVWARNQQVGIGVPAGVVGTFKFNLLAPFEADSGMNPYGCTVARIRGVYACVPSASPVPGSGLLIAGIRVGADQEVSGGTPPGGPLSQPHLDWMSWEAFPFADSAAADVQQSGDSVALSRVFDVKSMRKLGEVNEELQLWFEASSIAASTAYVISASISTLLLLP